MRLRAIGPRIRRTPEGCAFGPEITEGSHREMARLEGFEPPTNGFGSHYSIRLSYRRVYRAAHCATDGLPWASFTYGAAPRRLATGRGRTRGQRR